MHVLEAAFFANLSKPKMVLDPMTAEPGDRAMLRAALRRALGLAATLGMVVIALQVASARAVGQGGGDLVASAISAK